MDVKGQKLTLQRVFESGFVKGGGGKGLLTIHRMFMNDFHDTNDTRDFAVGVVKERLVSLHHGPHVVPGYWRGESTG